MNTSHQSAVDTSVERLSKLINLPVRPSEAWFEQLTIGQPGAPGPTDYELLVVMRFAPNDLDELARISSQSRGEVEMGDELRRAWLPAPIPAALKPTGRGSYRVEDGRKFDASAFARPPLSMGYFIVVGATGYVVLALQTS